MAQEPVQARHEGGHGTGTADTAGPDAQDFGYAGPMPPEYYQQAPVFWQPPVPKVVVRRDLLPALSALSVVSVLGLAVGWLWSLLAPPEQVRVFPEGQLVPLRIESYHRFDDLALFLLLGIAAGLVTGTAAWLLRERRGPVLMIAVVAGGAIGAWLAMRVGLSWAETRYALPAGAQVGDVVSQAPRLETGWGIVAWPMAAALAYGILAAWNGLDDLGRRLG